jgi:hypothetical protein
MSPFASKIDFVKDWQQSTAILKTDRSLFLEQVPMYPSWSKARQLEGAHTLYVGHRSEQAHMKLSQITTSRESRKQKLMFGYYVKM